AAVATGPGSDSGPGAIRTLQTTFSGASDGSDASRTTRQPQCLLLHAAPPGEEVSSRAQCGHLLRRDRVDCRDGVCGIPPLDHDRLQRRWTRALYASHRGRDSVMAGVIAA